MKNLIKEYDVDLIREKAYFLWKDAGCPDSDGVEFWLIDKIFQDQV